MRQSPKYRFWVQIKDHSELTQHTRAFLESHATKSLAEISVEDINEFLGECYRRANFAGEAFRSDVKAPV